MIQCTVIGQALKIKQPIIAAETIDYLEIEFNCSDEWAGAEKVVYVKRHEQDAQAYAFYLDGDTLTREQHLNLTDGIYDIWLVGFVHENGELKERITTVPDELIVEETGELDGEPVPIEPPTLGEQILLKAAAAEEKAQAVVDAAARGDFKGDPGEPGRPGSDATVTAESVKAALGFTPADAENVPTKEDLSDFADNRVGYSEVVNGQLVMWSDSTKEHLLATLDLPSGGGISGVKIDGTSLIPDSGGVVDIPAMSSSQAGVALASNTFGTGVQHGSNGWYVTTAKASNADIDARTNNYRVATPSNLAYYVKSGMTAPESTKDPAWTAEEQAAARERMGIVTLTQEEYDLITETGQNTIYLIVG